MELTDFNHLDEIRQAEAILNYGVLLGERAYKSFTIFLYQVNHFYVEVYYHNTYTMIQGFRGFESTHALEPYLRKIDITSLHC